MYDSAGEPGRSAGLPAARHQQDATQELHQQMPRSILRISHDPYT